MKCPVCDARDPRIFLERSGVPVHQNLLFSNVEAALAVNRGDLRLAHCRSCGFVFNDGFEEAKLEYGAEYDNTRDYSPSFTEYIDDLVGRVVGDAAAGTRVVEVGCGNGAFLRRVVEVGGGSVIGRGFDPSYSGPLVDADGLLRFERCFYGTDSAREPADIVVCRHVIEHVADPVELLRSIRCALKGSKQARLFLETPCVEWILENGAVWDFFYEHCSYFCPQSIAKALERAGFQTRSIEHVFGGQYLWVEAVVGDASGSYDVPPTKRFEVDPEWQKQLIPLQNRVERLAAQSKLALWGAGAKGVTLANLVDPEAKLFACVVDINPNKQGCWIAGTRHRIVGHTELAGLGVEACLLTNPIYAGEVRRLLGGVGGDIELVDVMALGDDE